MKIACLGWGSLIWDPRCLPMRGDWFSVGPLLPIEFARVSSDERVTLVTTNVAYRVRALWTLLSSPDLETAKRDLALRERVPETQIERWIGYCDCRSENQNGRYADEIRTWANAVQLDCVVWTNLQAGTEETRTDEPLSCHAVIEHLKSLPHNRRQVAKEYILNAPTQIDTEYRRAILLEFGW